MRPENRYGQMTPAERVAFALSDEGKNYLFPWGFTVDGKRYEKMVPGRVARVFNEEADPPQTRTGVATRTKTTSSGPAAASAKRGRWSLRR